MDYYSAMKYWNLFQGMLCSTLWAGSWVTSFSLDSGTLDSPMGQKLYFLGSFVDEVSHVTQLSPNWLRSPRFEKRREQSPWPHRRQNILLLSRRPVGSSQQPMWVLSPLVTWVWSSGWSHQWHLARKAIYCLSNLPGCVAAKACSQFPWRSWRQTNMIFKSAFWLN